MKKIFAILFVLAIGLSSVVQAQSDQRYAYVKKSNVNLRATPSTSGQVVAKAQEGDFMHVFGESGDWVNVCYEIFDEETAYINKSMIVLLTDTGFPADKLDATFSVNEGDLTGYLTFEKNGGEVKYDYMLKSKEMVKAGGSGVIDRGDGEINYDGDNLYQPSSWPLGRENQFGTPYVIYDKNTRQLFFGGILWTED